MELYSLLRGKRLEFLGNSEEKGYEIDFSRPWGDKCGRCGHKLYLAKDIYNGYPISDIVICSWCGVAYKLVPLLLLADKGEKEKKENEKDLLRF